MILVNTFYQKIVVIISITNIGTNIGTRVNSSAYIMINYNYNSEVQAHLYVINLNSVPL